MSVDSIKAPCCGKYHNHYGGADMAIYLKTLVLLAAILWGGISKPLHAQNVDSGIWWNPSDAGWGLSIEQQNNVLVVIGYTYSSTTGAGIWFFTSGVMSSTTTYSGRMQTYAGGSPPGGVGTGAAPAT